MKVIGRLFLLSIMVVLFSCKENEPAPVVKNSPTPDSITRENPDTGASNPYVVLDVSPMDMSYFPPDYPKLKMAKKVMQPPVMRLIYSRPHLQGREIFHDVLKYGESWRLGANESTEIEFFRDVTILNKKVKQGRYILYSILGPSSWDIVLNSNVDTWGLQQDSTRDVQHFDIPVTHGNPELEYFTMLFEKTNTGADLVIAWDDVMARVPINF